LPFGPIDKNIIALVELISAFAESNLSIQLIEADNLLIAHSQWLLKAEWEKAKVEAGGLLARMYAPANARLHLRRYRLFCENEGAFAHLTQIPVKD
jgi:hypothetical protein